MTVEARYLEKLFAFKELKFIKNKLENSDGIYFPTQ